MSLVEICVRVLMRNHLFHGDLLHHGLVYHVVYSGGELLFTEAVVLKWSNGLEHHLRLNWILLELPFQFHPPVLKPSSHLKHNMKMD